MITECLLVTFHIEGDGCPLADASNAGNVTIDARPPLLRHDGNVLLQFSAPPTDDLSRVLDADDRVRYLHRSRLDGRDNYRCVSLHPCVVHELISEGFLVESLTYENGNAKLTGTVVGTDILRQVMEKAGETVGVQLERVAELGVEDDDAVARHWSLTAPQEEALRAAARMGYFHVPRAVTATEVADALDISKSAFLERLRRAQDSLFEQLFFRTGKAR